jgi:DNA polymerase alpha subunit B
MCQEDVVVVGRIVANAEIAAMSGPSKLSEASVALESSRMMGSGVRVPLRFNTPLKIYGSSRVGFFPGAIVALRGRNGGGGWFSVSEVLSVSEDLYHVSPTLIKNVAAAAYEWPSTSTEGRRRELV